MYTVKKKTINIITGIWILQFPLISVYNISIFFYSYDLILLGDAQTFLKKFLEFKANMVFSAEGFCWPDRWLKVSAMTSVCGLFFCISLSLGPCARGFLLSALRGSGQRAIANGWWVVSSWQPTIVAGKYVEVDR